MLLNTHKFFSFSLNLCFFVSKVTDTAITNAGWKGFSNKVNVYISGEAYNGTTKYTDSTYKANIVIDTLGGKTVTADDVSKFGYSSATCYEFGSFGGVGFTGSPVFSRMYA